MESAEAHKAGEAFTVRLAKTRGEYEVKEGESVLDVLLAAGVDAPCSCRQGICGECIVRVLAGEPDHFDDIRPTVSAPTACSPRAPHEHSHRCWSWTYAPHVPHLPCESTTVEAIEQAEAAWLASRPWSRARRRCSPSCSTTALSSTARSGRPTAGGLRPLRPDPAEGRRLAHMHQSKRHAPA